METKHTPGPWLFRLEAVRTVIFHQAEIGERAIAVGAGHYPDHIANARLIAAAPELLAACQRAINYISASESEYGIELDSGNALRAAIAKATGQ